MRGIIGKLCWGRAVGAYLSDGRIIVTEVGATLSGPKRLSTRHAEAGEEGLGVALQALLEGHYTPRQRRRMPVRVGLGAEQTFFATRPFSHDQQHGPSLDDLLVASGAASVWESSQTVADYVKVEKLKVTGSSVYSVVASRRELAEELFAALKAAGVQNASLEPAPWSVLEAVGRRGQAPRRWKLHVRVLLQDGAGLALLVAEGQPVIWRRFAFGAAQAPQMIGSALRSVLVHAAISLGIRKIDGVVLQGDGAKEVAGKLAEDLGLETLAVEGEGFTPDLCSYALAASARRDGRRLDLFGSLRPPPAIRDIFPWKLAAFVAMVATGMLLMLWERSSRLSGELAQVRRQAMAHAWAAGQTAPAITQQRKRLTADVDTVGRFLSTRIVWSDYLRDLPTRLPPNACLSNIAALCELKDTSKRKQKRSTAKTLTLKGAARFADRWAAPREIDAFLEGLRNVDLLRRDFPRVQLAEIKWRREGNSDVAMFTVIALPKTPGGAGGKE